MKRKLFLPLFCLLPLYLFGTELTIEEVQKQASKYHKKQITLRGTVITSGKVVFPKGGYFYCILKGKRQTLQVRFPLQGKHPKLHEIIQVQGIFYHTKYGNYLKGQKFQVIGKKSPPKPKLQLGMDEKTARRMAQVMKLMQQMTKLRRSIEQMEKFFQNFGIDPEKLFKESQKRLQKLLRQWGITEQDLQRFVQKLVLRYQQARRIWNRLKREYKPLLEKLQRELLKKLKEEWQKQKGTL